jgi:hypothetical protein
MESRTHDADAEAEAEAASERRGAGDAPADGREVYEPPRVSSLGSIHGGTHMGS